MHRTAFRAARALPGLLAGAALAALGSSEAGAVLTGVCPDGSMFIVQSSASIPCERAKLVDPNEMPPLKPELLPRPYAWDRFQREQDPNNPYNLIGSERPSHAVPPQASPVPPQHAALPAPSQRATGAPGPRAGEPLALGLGRDDIENLFLIVELAQQRAPATFRLPDGDGRDALTLRLAHSRAFEPRLKDFWARRGPVPEGPVVLFSAVAARAESFHANFTFVQGHRAFHPDRADPRQLGLVSGRLGPQRAGDSVLGYVILPEHIDPSQPLDIYWDDRLVEATLEGS